MNLSRITDYYRLGGFKLLFKKCCCTSSEDICRAIYEICLSANPDDYPRMLKSIYRIKTDSTLKLENPQTFNEKVQWLKLYDSTQLKTKLADKYLVREWVKEKIGEQFLIPILGVWNSFDEIDFDALPNSFVLKCNHGSGMNLVVTNKSVLDVAAAKKQFDEWMDTNFAFVAGLELQYRDIQRRIIAEEYIEQFDNNLMDYKIHVFNGNPRIIQLIGDRDLHSHTGKEISLTTEWEKQEWMYQTYDFYEIIPERPDNIDKMLGIAHILGEGFKYVRVDLYNLDGRILFGEMTFTPASGFGRWGDYRSNQLVGSWINLL